MKYNFHPYLFNPLYWVLQWALRNDDIRYIFIYGGSSAAKTYSITQALTKEAAESKASTMVLRKFGVDIEDSVYADFKDVGERLQYDQVQTYIKRVIRYVNGAINRFRGLDESEKLKGLKGFKYLYYNELSLFEFADFKQGRKRLRGMKGQKIIGDWNPIIQTHWIKTEILDKEEWTDLEITKEMLGAPTKYCKLDPNNSFVRINASGNMLLIKCTYQDNYWVVGHPSGKGGFYDQHVIADFEYDKKHNPNDYRIYGLGDWGLVRTGSEFWKSFNEAVHVKPLAFAPGNVHVSFDNNVQPYVTISIWQVSDKEKKIRQVHEIPAKSPNNNASRAATLLCDWLDKVGFQDMLYLNGDPSANASSTTDDNGRSFFDKVKAVLRERGVKFTDRVGRSAPGVAISAEFINQIYEKGFEGWTIEIAQQCRVSIDDYCMTKENQDGGVLKKRINDKEAGTSYEQYGHFSDAKRYFIIELLSAEFSRFRSRNRTGLVRIN